MGSFPVAISSNLVLAITFIMQKPINQLIIPGRVSLKKRFPPIFFYAFQGEYVVKTSPTYIIPLLTFLKIHTEFNYNQLRDITAIDYTKRKLRFEIVYQLLSLTYNQRLIVSTSVSEIDSMESATIIYSSAGWYERETWDIFGIFFHNHSDIRRILTDYGFKGHPIRKDFPLTGFVEVRYNDFRKRVLYEKVNLAQEFRNFIN